MEPSGPTSGIPLPLTHWRQVPPPPLQVGQLLQATVVENNAGKILLAISHRQLSAESSLPFKPGQVLTLEVRSLGDQPVFKVIAALQESATATAIRQLLPRYGATTPLLASLPRLAQAPAGTLPPALSEVARTLLRQLPDRIALSSARGLKTAIEHSGTFLEHQLAGSGDAEIPSSALTSDFKANLLRLLVQLRNLPGGDNSPASTAASSRPTATPPGVPPAKQHTAQEPVDSRSPAANSGDSANTAASAPRSTAANPQVLQRALQADGTVLPQRATTTLLTGSPPGAPAPGTAGLNPPPPFAGVVPVPQAPVRASIDLLNSLGQLRLDLLQQTEAALARIHLNQFASLPRESEHRLVEWLFDIPVRRGDDIDLWSARLYRDAGGKTEAPAQPSPLWSVQLAFDLPGLGPVQAQINLQDERVSTYFRAAREETVPLLHAHLHELRRAMADAGLEVGDIDCRHGSIADGDRIPPEPLINEQA